MRLLRKPLLFFAALALLVLGWFAWPPITPGVGAGAAPVALSAINGGAAADASDASKGSRIVALDAANAPGALAAGGRAPTAATNADPKLARLQTLAALQSRGSVAQALRDAAISPELYSNSFIGELVSFCSRYTSDAVKAQTSADNYAPSRMRSSKAPLVTPLFAGAEESVRFKENTRAIVEFCRDFDRKAATAAEAAAIERLIAAGSPHAALVTEFGGNPNFTGLTPEQFAVIGKALTEQDIGTLALLGFQAQPLLNNALHAGNASLDGAREFAQRSGQLAWQLALCQLGAYCGSDSLWARDACFRFGACGGDLAAALRGTLARDGIDATALDQQAARYAEAIRSGDPTQLHFRRKAP